MPHQPPGLGPTKDKSVLEKGRYIYSIRRADPAWQITGVTNVDPDFAGPGDYPRSFG